jgi:hypothetical protein
MGRGGEREGQSRCPIALTAGHVKDDPPVGVSWRKRFVCTMTVLTQWCDCRGLKCARSCAFCPLVAPLCARSAPSACSLCLPVPVCPALCRCCFCCSDRPLPRFGQSHAGVLTRDHESRADGWERVDHLDCLGLGQQGANRLLDARRGEAHAATVGQRRGRAGGRGGSSGSGGCGGRGCSCRQRHGHGCSGARCSHEVRRHTATQVHGGRGWRREERTRRKRIEGKARASKAELVLGGQSDGRGG